MLSKYDFVRQSLDLHLFFGRIMKEHALFLQLSFTPRDSKFTQQADNFRRRFDRLLREAILLSNGCVSDDVLTSEELFTQYTLNAEMAVCRLTGIKIPTELTCAEMRLSSCGDFAVNKRLVQMVCALNQSIIEATSALIEFKCTVLNNVLCCNMFTSNYPLWIDHIMREAKLYLHMTKTLQTYKDFVLSRDTVEQELFWNTIMDEHAKFTRGKLDPSENSLILTADDFAHEFDRLVDESMDVLDNQIADSQLTAESMDATQRFSDFNAQGAEGILSCNVKSVILPLTADHDLREANHYLRLLNTFKNIPAACPNN